MPRLCANRIAALVAAATVALPVFGAWHAGRPLRHLIEYPPPLAIPSEYPRFSWIAAALVLTACAVGAVMTVIAGREGRRQAGALPRADDPRRSVRAAANPASPRDERRTTLTLILAWVWTALWWALAWTRFEPFAWVQPYTFFPLWLGFIVAVNALAWRRWGTCLMRRAPKRWLALFAVSAIFWWGFEWLNRFVQNWHYLGVESFGPVGYAVHASLCFSTVLPAVAAVREWLGHDRAWLRNFSRGPAWPAFNRRGLGFVLGLVALAELVLLGAHPQEHYGAVWAAPLALALGLLILSPGHALRPIAAGDWRPVIAWALAALLCGVFWEMWNVASLAKWVYTVPYVDRWHVFEMPLLGYSGYLPFGWLCGLATTWVLGGNPNPAEPKPT